MKTYTVEYAIGESVYMKTDLEQTQYLVTGIHIRPNGVSYSASSNGLEYTVYALEITSKKDELKHLGIHAPS